MSAFLVGPGETGSRLDRFLVAATAGSLSRSRLKQLIEEGAVAVDGIVAADAAHLVKGEQRVVLTLPPPVRPSRRGEAIPLAIVYEDDAPDRHRQAGRARRPSGRRATRPARWSTR